MGLHGMKNLSQFIAALGLSGPKIEDLLYEDEDFLYDGPKRQLVMALIYAEEFDRLTPENLAYALEQSGNADLLSRYP